MANKGSNSILFKIENDTLFVGKHGAMMGYFFKLYFPPIHLYGNEDIEREAIDKCTKEGLSLRMDGHKADQWGINTKKIPEYEGACEVFYHRDYDLSSKRYKNIRAERKHFLHRIECKDIEVVVDYPLGKLLSLNEVWLKQQGYKKSVFDYCYHNQKDIPNLTNMTILDKNGDPITSILYVVFSRSKWHGIGAVSDYEKAKSGLQRQSYLHLFDLHHEVDLMIAGGYRSEGVKFSKTAIPHTIVEVRNVPSQIKLTKQMWGTFKTPETFFGV